ncbi:MAG: anthranilate synthase component I family protein [Proteobacteria bacterium]|nr:anthranilate synthase component I family protein [Pseudomonadota bacterium]
MSTNLPDFTAFASAAAAAELVALCVPLAFDHETAVTLADRFIHEEHMFLLESAASGGPNARHSFLGFDPLWSWRVDDARSGEAVLVTGARREHLTMPAGNPLAGLRELMQQRRLVSVYPPGTRLGGPDTAAMVGASGFLGFDVGSALEPSAGTAPPKTLGLPDAFFFFPRNFLVLDHLSRRLFVSRNVLIDVQGETELRQVYDAEIKQLSAMLRRLTSVHGPAPLALTERPVDFDACSASMTKAEFMERGQRCLEAVKAGDIFQIQIGNRLSLPTDARPFDIFRHLRMINPSPYMFFYKLGEHHVLGASPEMMVGVQGQRLTHRPIAGTRRRTWDSVKDAQMRQELVESEKERAEHVMLVDLARNDIGRLALPGTVQVEELMTVEEYSHVFHMVSQVTGSLPAGKDAYDAMQVSFPNGTVSGAPKIKAMQLINQLEKISREFYAGSLGIFDVRGNLKSTLLIRTIHVAHGVASTQASAGFVYDSVPEQEWLETRNKMTACLLAMQNTH